MAGHSKWAQIKRKKAVTDAKKGALFSKFARAITLAARDNADPATNGHLADEIARARAANMPGESIERALRRVTEQDASALQEMTVDIIGPGNAAVIVSAITDNTNRTMGEIRRIAEKHGVRIGDRNSLAWMFRRVAEFRLPADEDRDALQLAAIDAGADDVSVKDGELVITAPAERADAVRAALGDRSSDSRLTLVPTVPASLSSGQGTELEALLDALDEQDDTQDVVTNAEY
ncbi:MAG TPA: YebC/PmpR family DNA-binding transcriptional regulator [Candidatus Paceibacterota bacterium]|nr:YebC/PmpR family DNA-binding transcriptional regulator [Candidatus Paceibacterota bacterium]